MRHPPEALAGFAGGSTLTFDSRLLGARPFIVTVNDVPGYRITDVFGLVVVARDYLGNIGAQFRSLCGGEVTSFIDLLIDSRNRARSRLWAEACEMGANAVVAFHFDCTDFAQVMCEVAAYGTAVTVERIPTGPRPPAPDVVATA